MENQASRCFLDNSGKYTIRSGYKMLLRGYLRTDDDCYNNISQTTRLLYKHLWGTKVPKKMKIKCWCYINNFLPTKVNLYQRRLRFDCMCPHYGSSPETILHVCRDCLSILHIWQHLNISWDPILVTDDTPINWVGQLFSKGHRYVQLTILTIWTIWHSRNKVVHQGVFQ